MKQILKRLELIQASIAIDEEEIIELQIMKLHKLSLDEDVQNIVKKLENLDYATALVDIQEYLKKYSGVVEYVDSELQALKLELHSLEEKLQKLSQDKQEYIHEIDEFHTLYSIKLGGLIQEILKVKEQILQNSIKEYKEQHEKNKQELCETEETIGEIKNTIEQLGKILEELDNNDEDYDEIYATYIELQDELEKLQEELKTQEDRLETEELEDGSLYEEYEEAKTDYEEFRYEYEEIKEIHKESIELSDQDKKKLKKLWKKASRLCHPDIVADTLKKQATEIMQQLNDAYSTKNLEVVKKICNNLENGIAFEVASDTIDNKDILKLKIDEFRINLTKLEQELVEIQEDETFQIIQKFDDWDEYFEEVKTELEKELHQLKAYFRDEEIAFKEEKHTDLKGISITIEESIYAQSLYDITNISFEKIRRHCANLAKEHTQDLIAQFFSENARMYKAMVYDTLEQFIDEIKYNKINIIDWGCGQGIAVSLVLDYIKEKQLDIQVTQVILIDDDLKALSRAMLHCDVLKQNDLEIITIDVNDGIDKINEVKNGFALNLFVNNKKVVDFMDIELDRFRGDYFICVSNEDNTIIDTIYTQINSWKFITLELLTDRKTKVGRFEKYEKIFQITDALPKIDIDEIPF